MPSLRPKQPPLRTLSNMGWMEVLALLKRLGPTLSRLLPALEMFAATRGSSTANADALGRVSGELKDQIAAGAAHHAASTEALSVQVEAISKDLGRIREADGLAAARLLEVETQTVTLGKAVHQIRQLLIAVLMLSFALLAILVWSLFHR